jgi:hypothetical protein
MSTVYRLKADVLGWLAPGMSFAEILDDFPELTEEDIKACEELRQKIDVGTQQIARGQVTDGEIVFERIKAKINREYEED